MRRIAAIAIVAAATGASYVVALPPRAPVPAGQNQSTLVTGAIHVHTIGSDGTGTADEIAAAAARAGLDFIVLHRSRRWNEETRSPAIAPECSVLTR